MVYETVIGLEIHAELSTNSKIFCSCQNAFGGEANTRTCPVCMGMPGALPVLNQKVVELAIKAGLTFHCDIANYSKLNRKNYFYPDLPKAYQISQADMPLCKDGYMDIKINQTTKRIGITRIHIEEDAGKLVHETHAQYSVVDYNRCGIPLIEIVTEPDLRSPEEAQVFLETVKTHLSYIGVSDCKMQEGSLRCDVNVSLRPFGANTLGTRCEMKNINSFRAAIRAMHYEIARQTALLNSGNEIEQQTRRWDDALGKSFIMRTKENAQDYRFFPEPDIPPIVVTQEQIDEIKKTLPEDLNARKKRYQETYPLSVYDVQFLISSKAVADYFDQVLSYGCDPKLTVNILMGEVSAILNDRNLSFCDFPVSSTSFAELISLMEKETISNSVAKKVLTVMFDTGKPPKTIVDELGLAQISDQHVLLEWVEQAIIDNPKSVADFHAGKSKAKAFLIGQVMKLSRGKANPALLDTLFEENLTK